MFGLIGPISCLDESNDKDNFFCWINRLRFKSWVNIKSHKYRLLKNQRECILK